MATEIESLCYCLPVEHLQQGDVFAVDTVTPYADTNLRFFRATDGRHGSVVLAGLSEGRVFGKEALEDVIRSKINDDALFTRPFASSNNGEPELMVTCAGFTPYFVIGTQTCDVAGEKKNAPPLVTLLAVKTLRGICSSDRLPLDGLKLPSLTIEEFLIRETGHSGLDSCNEFEYSHKLRELLNGWNPTGTLLASRNSIRRFLDKMGKSGFQFYLPADAGFGLPEMYIDLSATFTIHILQLQSLAGRRVARIKDPYRDQFSHQLGHHFSRIAVPQTLAPHAF